MTTTLLHHPSIPKNALLTRVVSLGTAVPAFSSTQTEILKFILSRFDIRPGTKKLYEKTLSNPSIYKRHFAVNDLSEVLERDHKKISDRFQRAAAELSNRALTSALRNGGVSADSIDFIVVATCTGYLCPGLSSYVIEHAGLRRDIQTADLTGMGCGAAIPALQQAHNFVQTHPNSTAVVICVEICSAAMFSNDDVDIVISNTIFSDGAACAILRSESDITSNGTGALHPQIKSFSSLLIPEWRETLRFDNNAGYLKNVLGKDVPQQSALAVERVTRDLLEKAELRPNDVQHWMLHAGGEKIIDTVEHALKLKTSSLEPSRRVLNQFGNMSSPTVLFVLAEHQKTHMPKKGDLAILSSFGAGFSAYAALLEY